MGRGSAARNNTAGQKKQTSADNATSEEQCNARKIFVGGLAHKTTTQHLREHFQRYGNVVDAVVLRWPDGRSRGFGYATFADAASATAALRQTHELGDRQVDTKRAVPGTNKLFVGGLPQNTTAAELRQHFEEIGTVCDAVVMIDAASGRSRGFGFVCFLPGNEGAVAVDAALSNYENHRIRGKWIEVKSASPAHRLVAKEKTCSDAPAAVGADSSSSDKHALTSIEELAPLAADSCPKKGTSGRAGASPLTVNGRSVATPFRRPPGLADPVKVALPSAVMSPSTVASIPEVAEGLPSPRMASFTGSPPETGYPSALLPGMLAGTSAASGSMLPTALPCNDQQRVLQLQWMYALAAAAAAQRLPAPVPPVGLVPPAFFLHPHMGHAANTEAEVRKELQEPSATLGLDSTFGGMNLPAHVPSSIMHGGLDATPEFQLNLEELLRRSLQ